MINVRGWNPTTSSFVQTSRTGGQYQQQHMHDPNSTEYGRNDSTDNSCKEKEDSVNKLKVNDNKDNDDG